MSIEVGESGEEIRWWEWEEQDFPTRKAPAPYETFQSTVPLSQAYYSYAKTTYTPLFDAHIVLCGDDKSREKTSEGSWEVSASASKDTQGNSKGEVGIDVHAKTDSGLDWSAGVGGGIRQDKEGNVSTDAYGRVTLRGDF